MTEQELLADCLRRLNQLGLAYMLTGADKNLALRNGSKPIDWARDERMRQLLGQP